ncbi:MAG: hypothetical protein SO016_00930 [Lachnospiraceae bacterium]|nr:hypothetical protein [Robinsoniella sp.]MDY3765251.1 hypothetical protein [Lachnospiraceae bacterium]
MKKVAAIVKGEKIYESEVEGCAEYLKQNYQKQKRRAVTSEEEQKLREQALQMLIQVRIARMKAKDLKLDQFSKEQQDKLQEVAKKNWNELLQTCKEAIKKSNPSMSNEELDKKAREHMAAKGYGNSDPIFYALMNNEIFNRVQAYATRDVQVTDEEVRKTYDGFVERDTKAFEGNVPQYERVVARYGNVSYYIPAGYRSVTHIRLEGDAEKQKELKELLYEANGAPKAEVDAEKEAKLRAEILESVQEKVDEIQKAYAEGTNFKDLMEKYSDDKKTGWSIHKDSIFWEKPAIEAAMEIKEKGDISVPAPCSNGVFVFRYESDARSGVLPYSDTLKENLRAVLYRQKVNDQFMRTLKQWGEE